MNDDPLSQAAAGVPTKGTQDVAPYDDLDKMPFGQFQGTVLQDVPASYFHYLWKNRPISDRRLEAYIKKSLTALKQEHPDGLWT